MTIKYKPTWGAPAHVLNEVHENAVKRLGGEDAKNLDLSIDKLTGIRNMGDKGALEVLARLGLFLNNELDEFNKLSNRLPASNKKGH